MAFIGFFFSTGNYDPNNTLPIYSNNAWWWPSIQDTVKEVKTLSVKALQRLRLAALRTFPSPNFMPLVPQRAGVTFAPRRTVVPRGIVSWVRMGTRRPL